MLFHPSSESSRLRKSLRGSFLAIGIVMAAFVAGACSASPGATEPEDGDLDNDKVLDSLGKTIDADGNGEADQFDINGDGVLDGVGVDTNKDGRLDAIGYDTDGDGIIDALDTTGDGIPDVRTPVPGDGDGDIVVPVGDGDGDEVPSEYCDEFELMFEPKTPTVYLLVDRSGSMGTTQEGFWAPLRDGLLPAVQALEADVRFGFGTYSSTMPSQCTAPTSVLDDLGTIDQNNYTAIAAKYNAYTDPTTGDTPTPAALAEATALLLADPSPGDRYIVLVTDGNPDFCDNGNAICPQDATIGALQATHAAGIKTIVFGLEAKQYPIDAGVMSSFANAGDGQAVNWSAGLPIAEQGGNTRIGNECGGMVRGTYSEPGGTATAFLGADPAALVTALQATVAGLKSCTFEFNFEVKDETKGDIFVDDPVTPIPEDQWEMVNETTMLLTGDACTRWQGENVSFFKAGFPCEAIVVVVR